MKLLQRFIQYIIICIFVSIPFVIHAQISITSSDVMGLLGNSQEIENDTSGSMTINVGSAGANQSWDLTTVSVQGSRGTVNYQTPQNTPLATYFPAANFVYSFVDTSGSEGYDEIIFYDYVEVTSSNYSSLGGGVEIPDLDTSFVIYMSDDVAPLPLTYNSSWVSTESDTSGDPATFAIIELDTTTNNVDGWGTVQLPIGIFNCLRVRADNKYTQVTYVGGQIQSINITNNITYSWISKDNFIVAEAESQDNDVNPNFTTAVEFQWLVSPLTGIETKPELTVTPLKFKLFQNYPNPFNPTTTIEYYLSSAAQTELKIYNHIGQEIKTLVNTKQPSGNYSVQWDGRDNKGNSAASGIYFYRLKTESSSKICKMILLR